MTKIKLTKQQEIAKLQAQIDSVNREIKYFIDFPDKNDKGVPLGTNENFKAMLDYYNISIRYNEMSKEQEIIIPQKKFHCDTAANAQLTYLEDLAIQASLPYSRVAQQIDMVANENTYHPFCEWITKIKWDGISRLQNYYNLIETTTDTDKKELYMRKWALSIVAAAFREDYRFGAEGVLTLLGGQGAAKTSFAENLFPRKYHSWVITGCSIDPHNKDTLLKALGGVVSELGEMGTTFRKADQEALKAFLTEKKDTLRPPYAKKANVYSRRTVFFGTSNKFAILDDDENRRYWPLTDVSFPNVKIDLEQFWAEMLDMYNRLLPLMDTRADSVKSGEWGWYLSPSERVDLTKEQEDIMTISPIIQKLEYVLVESELCNDKDSDVEWLGATIICNRAGILNPNKANANEAAAWLKAKGYLYNKKLKRFGVNFKYNEVEKVESGGLIDYCKGIEDIKKDIENAVKKRGKYV
jgi:hypothetical protein